MKGAIKTEEVNGMNFDIRKEGASLALECQSIFTILFTSNNVNLDADVDVGLTMITSMTKDIVIRIKNVLKECIVSPKITDESFEELPYIIIPKLFYAVYEYQTKEAIKKKLDSSNSQDSQTNSEKKNSEDT